MAPLLLMIQRIADSLNKYFESTFTQEDLTSIPVPTFKCDENISEVSQLCYTGTSWVHLKTTKPQALIDYTHSSSSPAPTLSVLL